MNINENNDKMNKLIRVLAIVEAVLLTIILVTGAFAVHTWHTVLKEDGNPRKQVIAPNQQTDGAATAEDTSGASKESEDEDISGASKEEEGSDQSQPGENSDHLSEEIKEMISDMTLEEKVMQMFMITPEALVDHVKSTVTAAGDITKTSLDKYHVGGIFFSAQNLKDPEQVESMLENMQEYSVEYSGIPLFFSLDEEGGTVSRIASNSAFGVADVGNMRDIYSAEDAYKAGTYIGSYLSELGFNLDFAPVADVITNSKNEVVAKRSFGSNPLAVSEYVLAFVNGLHENDVLGCMKHFPGHGGTTSDSHNGEAVSDRTLEEIRSSELVPFQNGIDAGVQIIMVGHITLPEITADEPASLSKAVVTNLLREEMGFQGIVITDAMNMQAVTDNNDSASAALKAVEAGVDMILLPVDFPSAYKAIVDAVNSGEITEERIEQSVSRILAVKKNSLDWQ